MSTDSELLQTRKTAILQELAAMDGTQAGGQPTYNIENQSVQHTEYRLSLYRELAEIDRALSMELGIFDITSQMG